MGMYAQAQAGDPEALAALIRRHIPLVQALTLRFSSCEDTFQRGCMGLVLAIRRYREDAGFAFSTYAVPVILGEMRREYDRGLGWRSRAALRKARKYQERYWEQTGREPSVRDMASAAGLTPEELVMMLEKSSGPVYDETGTLLSSLPDPGGEDWLLRFCVRDALDRLPPGEGWLLRERYFAGHSQTELARMLRASQSHVSRREARAKMDFRRQWLDADT